MLTLLKAFQNFTVIYCYLFNGINALQYDQLLITRVSTGKLACLSVSMQLADRGSNAPAVASAH